MGATAVDTEQMAVVRARLEHVAADLEAVAAEMVAAPVLALGAGRLVSALERAREDWALHARSLRRLADVAAVDLGRAASAYDACEQEVSARAGAPAVADGRATPAQPLVGPPAPPPVLPHGPLLGPLLGPPPAPLVPPAGSSVPSAGAGS